MRLRLVSLAAALAFLGAFVLAPLTAGAQPKTGSGSLTAPVTGTVTSPGGGTFTGNLDITRFASQNG